MPAQALAALLLHASLRAAETRAERAYRRLAARGERVAYALILSALQRARKAVSVPLIVTGLQTQLPQPIDAAFRRYVPALDRMLREKLTRLFYKLYLESRRQTAAVLDQGEGVRPLRALVENPIDPTGVDPYAEAITWARTQAGLLITNISEETREAVQELVARAFEFGVPPEQLARQLAGFVGLTSRQMHTLLGIYGAMTTARAGQIVEAGSRQYVTPEEGFDPDDVQEAMNRYADRALRTRARMIARTECLPGPTLVDAAVVLAVHRRWYDGDMVEITTRHGRHFTATPNHPVFTHRGWVGAGDVREGDNLVCDRFEQHTGASGNVNKARPPATIAEIFQAVAVVGVVERRDTTHHDFHGDGRDGEVDVARPFGPLVFGRFTPLTQPVIDRFLAPADKAHAPCCLACGRLLTVDKPVCLCLTAKRDASVAESATDASFVDVIGSFQLLERDTGRVFGFDFVHREVGAVVSGASGHVAVGDRDAVGAKDFGDPSRVGGHGGGDSLHGHVAADIQLDCVVSIRVRPFHGHVYNLTTTDGYFASNGGIYTSNTIAAAAAGQDAMWHRAVDSGWLPPNQRRRWSAAPDERTCPVCFGLNGQVVGLDEPFISSIGQIQMPPAHPNCRCAAVLVIETIEANPTQDFEPGTFDDEEPTDAALFEALYSELQPRVPAGSPDGGQWIGGMTSTPEFKAWFKKSKVVDAHGKPLVVYRGDKPNKTTFEPAESTLAPGNIFFASNPKVARYYSPHRFDYMTDPATLDEQDGLYRSYLSIQRPLVIDAGGNMWDEVPVPAKLVKEFVYPTAQIDVIASVARKHGYDGLIVKDVLDEGGDGDQYVVFHPAQVKRVARTSFGRFAYDATQPRVPAGNPDGGQWVVDASRQFDPTRHSTPGLPPGRAVQNPFAFRPDAWDKELTNPGSAAHAADTLSRKLVGLSAKELGQRMAEGLPDDDDGDISVRALIDGVMVSYYSKTVSMDRIFRKVDGKLQVEHQKLKIEDALQGRGVAKEILKSQMALYREVGVEAITLTAGSTGGGYAWAKYGFKAINPSRLAATIDKRLGDKYSATTARAIRKVLNESRNDPKLPWIVAGLREGAREVGKELLRGTEWDGIFRLDDAEAMSRFTHYVNQKPVPKAAAAHDDDMPDWFWDELLGPDDYPDPYAVDISNPARFAYSKDQPRHPKGDPQGGQFAPADGGVDVPLAPDAESSLADLKRAGNWKLTLKESTEDTRRYAVEPITVPDRIKTAKVGINEREVLYDPALASVARDEYGQAFIKPREGSAQFMDDVPDVSRDDGYLYRGMAYAEWLHVQQTGKIESAGSYNLGDEQHGLTHFSTDPAQAGSYAAGFAPWMYSPTFDRPAIVVRVKDPGTSRHVKGTGETERGIPHAISLADITDVYEGHPYQVRSGEFELYRGHDGKYREGSRGGMSSPVVWRKVTKMRAAVGWLQRLLYSKDQPRHPKGSPQGGEFAPADGGRLVWQGGDEDTDWIPSIPNYSRRDERDRVYAERALEETIGGGFTRVDRSDPAVRMAKVTRNVLEEMKRKGYKPPTSVAVELLRDSVGPAGEISGRTLGMSIMLPASLPKGADLDAVTALVYSGKTDDGTRKFVARTARDLVIHEMGHVQHLKRVALRNAEWSLTPAEAKVARTVSDYGAQNAREFVAEAFLYQYNGGKLTPEAQKLYQRLKGPVIR